MVNEKILKQTAQFFMDSEFFFVFKLDCFFDFYGYYDVCYRQTGEKLEFTTAIYEEFKRVCSLQWGFRDYYSGHTLPDWALPYFSKNMTVEQLAWAIFAAWYGLGKKKCDLIVKNKRFAGVLLDYFLCGGTLEALEPIFVKGVSWKERRRAVVSNIPDLPCTVIDGEKQLAGIRHGIEIILTDTGERLSIGLSYEDLAQL